MFLLIFIDTINNIFNKWANEGERNIRNLYPQLSRKYDSEISESVNFYTLCY